MFESGGFFCHDCGRELQLDLPPGRRDECPGCGAELHACLNCAHYDASLARGCREPQAAEEARDPRRANFCSWFSFRRGAPDSTRASEADRAKAAFDALFKR